MKRISMATALLYSISTFAQISIGNIEEKKPAAVEIKVPVYDSSSNFKMQNKYENYKQYAGLQFYLPPKISFNTYQPVLYATYHKKTDDDIRNSYYTLIDVIQGDKLKSLLTADKLYFYHADNYVPVSRYPQLTSTYTFYFMMKNEKIGDTLLWIANNNGDFVLVPYFAKQKHLYEKKNFRYISEANRTEEDITTHSNINIEPNSKWMCKEVTLLKATQIGLHPEVDKYVISYVFTNDKSQTFATTANLFYPESKYDEAVKCFINEDEFNKKEQERIKKEQSNQLSRNARDAKQEEKDKAKYAEYVKKYGQANADLIVKRKVVVGMTQEMCLYSWGPFYKPSKVVNDQGIFETWHYSATSFLYFVNGILKEIKQ